MAAQEARAQEVVPKRFDGHNPHYTQTIRLKTYINTLLVVFAEITSWLKNYAMCLGFLRQGLLLLHNRNPTENLCYKK
jgi:hypothetical protein